MQKDMRAAIRADKMLRNEMTRQVDIVCGSTVLALWTYYGWRNKRIMRVMHRTEEFWMTCAGQPMVSMLMMLEDETGLIMQSRETSKSYHDLEYLNGKVEPHEMDIVQYVAMRTGQMKWVNPQLKAAVLLAMHRDFGWGGIKGQRLCDQIDEMAYEYGGEDWKQAKILKACQEITGINIFEEVRRE